MVLRSCLAGVLLCVAARADFSYEQTSKMTGGAMMGMMKMAGAFSKAAREPMRSTVMVKGDKMAMVSGERINIIDLDAETFTDVDLAKKTYASITFAEMGRAMQKMAEKMSQQKSADSANMQFKASVKPTGKHQGDTRAEYEADHRHFGDGRDRSEVGPDRRHGVHDGHVAGAEHAGL